MSKRISKLISKKIAKIISKISVSSGGGVTTSTGFEMIVIAGDYLHQRTEYI